MWILRTDATLCLVCKNNSKWSVCNRIYNMVSSYIFDVVVCFKPYAFYKMYVYVYESGVSVFLCTTKSYCRQVSQTELKECGESFECFPCKMQWVHSNLKKNSFVWFFFTRLCSPMYLKNCLCFRLSRVQCKVLQNKKQHQEHGANLPDGTLSSSRNKPHITTFR